MITKDKKTKPDTPAAKADRNLFLVYGEDEFLVSATARERVNQLCPPADQAFGLETIEGMAGTVEEAATAVVRCLEALQTIGFLGGRKVVWLKNANFFAAKSQVADSEAVKERVAQLVELLKAGLPPGQVLLISASKVFAGSAFFKTCKALGELQEFSLPDKPHEQKEAARYRALELFGQAGLKVPGAVLEAFLEKTAADTRSMTQEIEKLTIYLGNERREVRLEDVELVVSPTGEMLVWDLADAVGKRDLLKALRILRQLLFQGESDIGMVIGLENRFRELLIYREALERRWCRLSGSGDWPKVEWSQTPEVEATLTALGKRDPRATNPFRAGKLAQQAMNFTTAELVRGQTLAIAAHEGMVSSAVPAALQLELLLMALPGPKSRPGVAP